MSKVTIKELYWEIERDTYASKIWDEYKDIEVVPRKIVEMLIVRCEEIDRRYNDFANSIYHSGRRQSARELQEYAETLLKQFEKDDFSNTEKCSEEPLPFD